MKLLGVVCAFWIGFLAGRAVFDPLQMGENLMGLKTQTYRCVALVLPSAEDGGPNLCLVRADNWGHIPLDVQATVTVEGVELAGNLLERRQQLLRWFCANKDIHLEADHDPQQYDRVLAARFTAGPPA